MAHIHGAGFKIKTKMRRIMKAGHKLSQQLPTQEARDAKAKKDAEKLAEALNDMGNAAAAVIPKLEEVSKAVKKNLKDGTSGIKGEKESLPKEDSEV